MKINICMYSMASFTVARFQGRCHAHFSWTLFSEGTEIILWCFDFSNKSRLSKFFVCNIETFSDSRREFIFSIPSCVTPFYKFYTGIRAMDRPLFPHDRLHQCHDPTFQASTIACSIRLQNGPLMHRLLNMFHNQVLHRIKLFHRHKYHKQGHNKKSSQFYFL